MREPLVSILIPAYNAEDWIADTIRSALAQTWPRKEIIIVDDGSKDGTAEVASRFSSNQVAVVSKANEGSAATRNHALRLSRGDYVQWLDADDLLSPDKIERQLRVLQTTKDKGTLASCAWGYFYYRPRCARFIPTSLWHDLCPVEWLIRKMGENRHMQTATWLTSRELTERAGPWDTRLAVDDDGEYFCRVLLESKGTCFVPEAKVYYRASPSSRVSFIGASDQKKDALLLSMKLHIQYLCSLEDSERVRQACLAYLRTWCQAFYPDRMEVFAELQSMAAELNGKLEIPRLNRKYAWLEPLLGTELTRWTQVELAEKKASLIRRWDKMMFDLENRRAQL